MTRSPSVRSAVVAVVAVAAILVSSAAAAPTTPVITVTTDSSCSQQATCTDYDISIQNPGTLAMNGVTISIIPLAPITGFTLVGQPASKPTGAQDAWGIFPASIASGATAKGTFQVVAPLTSTDSISVYTTEDGFLSAVGVDVHLKAPTKKVPVKPPSKAGLKLAAYVLGVGIEHEKKALGEPTGKKMAAWTDIGRSQVEEAQNDLHRAGSSGAIGSDLENSIDTDLEKAIADDTQAAAAAAKDDLSSARRRLNEAISKKEAALRLLELALKQ